jgi:hypothetical protein
MTLRGIAALLVFFGLVASASAGFARRLFTKDAGTRRRLGEPLETVKEDPRLPVPAVSVARDHE